jgi:hypothetical protein
MVHEARMVHALRPPPADHTNGGTFAVAVQKLVEEYQGVRALAGAFPAPCMHSLAKMARENPR